MLEQAGVGIPDVPRAWSIPSHVGSGNGSSLLPDLLAGRQATTSKLLLYFPAAFSERFPHC